MKNMIMTCLFLLIFGCEKEEENFSPTSPKFTPSSSSSEGKDSAFWDIRKFPLRVHISDAFYGDEAQVIRDMNQTWNDAVEGKINFMDSAYTSTLKGMANLSDYKDAEIGVYKLTEWPGDLPLNVLGLTQITGYRRNVGSENEFIEIEHGDIFLNYEVFKFTVDDSWGYSLQSLVLHEVGHLLGLDHDFSSAQETVMYPYLSRDTKHHFPLERDRSSIKLKYGVGSLAARTMDNTEINRPENKVNLIFKLYKNGKETVWVGQGE